MKHPFDNQNQITEIYRQRAKDYNASGIRGLEPWRKKAVSALELKRGDVVIDIGCGTGLNFAPLQKAIGPEGKIIGVDLTDAMLDQARRRVAKHGWKNVELVHSDAGSYIFPGRVNGIIATFALSFVPDKAIVIQKGSQALSPGGKWVVLDMSWPEGWPLWLTRGLFFLSAWGITKDMIQRHPWQTIWKAMGKHLIHMERNSFWGGFFYLATGERPQSRFN